MKTKCYDLQKSLRNAKIVSNLWLNLSIQSDFTEGTKQQKYLNTKNFDENTTFWPKRILKENVFKGD